MYTSSIELLKIKTKKEMTILEDITLILKKIIVTIVIYLLPVTITVGGLLLTRHLLEDKAENNSPSQTNTTILKP